MALMVLLREALASIRSQIVASSMTMILVAGMVSVVLLTSGRTAGAEQSVLASIDTVGTRTIVVHADPGAGINTRVVDRLARLRGLTWLGAFSAAYDSRPANLPRQVGVPARYLYTPNLAKVGIPRTPRELRGTLAYGSAEVLANLGLPDAVGGVTLSSGIRLGLGTEIAPPAFLGVVGPTLIIPSPKLDGTGDVGLIVLVVSSPSLVDAISSAILPLLSAADPSKVSIETSATLAKLRAVVQARLGALSNSLLLGLLLLTAVLVAGVLSGLVSLRRRDFGRRRALGATRMSILLLIVIQTAILALVAAMVGSGISVLVDVSTRGPLPPAPFVAALAVVALWVAVLAAVVPGLVAGRRDPVKELRVP